MPPQATDSDGGSTLHASGSCMSLRIVDEAKADRHLGDGGPQRWTAATNRFFDFLRL
jgi:hypothetical protein